MKEIIAKEGITDARELGMPKYVILGIQHLFAMFGATILVPILTGLSVSSTLLFAGIGTLVFHFVSKLQVPAFLGSSFAFLGGYMSVKTLGVEQGMTETLALDYACVGVFCAGMCYFVMAGLIKSFGIDKILRYFPPLVTGPMIIAIGLVLSGSAIQNCTTNWLLAIVAVTTVIAANVWGKGILRIIPILLGVLVSYLTAVALGEVDFTALSDAAWIGLPFSKEQTVLAVFDDMDSTFLISTIIAILPIAIATIMEHIGDMCAISSTVGKDFLKEPGLHRTLMGDGLATALASLFGAPANTTYGENTGVLNLTKVFDPAVIRLAAVFAILLSFCPKFACLIGLIPTATIGGVSLILYGMISAVGVRNLIEDSVDFNSSRNVFVAASILVIAIGVKYGAEDNVSVGPIHFSGLALAALVGVTLNAILPGKLGMKVKSVHGKEKMTLLIALMAMTATLNAQPVTKTVKLKVIETSDVHGHFFPWDFMNNKPIDGTLTRANTYIKKQRAQYGERLLLIDNGDILQGQPCVYWTNYVMPEDENLAASVINYMKYDAETVGNHDIEPGHKVYDKWIREVRCPLLGANIVKEADKNGPANPKSIYTGLQPYSVHYIDGVKICIIGMLTPAIPNWLNKSIWKGLEFEEMTSCARKWVKYIQDTERPDLIFGLFHSGLNGGIKTAEYEEDATEAVAKEVPGFDIIFFGHDHQVHNEWITNKEGKKVLCIDPSCYVKNVAEAEIELTYKNGHLVKKDIKGEIVNVTGEAIDEQMLSHFQPKIDAVKQYVSRRIGRFENPVYSRDGFFGNSAFTDLIHNLQLKISGAEISFNAPLAFNSVIQAGDVTQADMFKLYRFENLMFMLRLTGEEVRKHLEYSYDMWTNTMTKPEDHILRLNENTSGDQQRTGFQYYTFNFDSACGIDYEVDVTKPDGQKVKILRMSNGEPFDEQKWYKVVMNSYRANGGGELLTVGAGIPKEELEKRVIWQTELDQRHYLTEEIRKMGVVDPQPNHNWKFVPEEWTKPALERDYKILFGNK